MSVTVLDVVIPVYNEEAQLSTSVERVLTHLGATHWDFRVTIADNASTDQTALIARRLRHTHTEVTVVDLAEKGRGRAQTGVECLGERRARLHGRRSLRRPRGAAAAGRSSGQQALRSGHRLPTLARLTGGAGARREFIWRSYNLILRRALRAHFSDAQCGFKAIRREAARELLPLVEDNAWSPTPSCSVVERAGLRIHEVPVDWTEDPDSSVDIVRTALDDLPGVARLGRSLVRGTLPLGEIGERLGRTSTEAGRGRLGLQVGIFLVIGVCSTLAYAVLFLLLSTAMSSGWANFKALLVTAIANTAANRRFTSGVDGRATRCATSSRGLVILAIGLAVMSGSLGALHALGSTHRGAEVVVLTTTNLGATVLRFVARKLWVFAVSPRAAGPGSPAATPTGSATAPRD